MTHQSHKSEFALPGRMREIATRILWDLFSPCRQQVTNVEKIRDDQISRAQKQLGAVEAEFNQITATHRGKYNDVKSKVNSAVSELDRFYAEAKSHLESQKIGIPTVREVHSAKKVSGDLQEELNELLSGLEHQRTAHKSLCDNKLLAYWPKNDGARWAIGCTGAILLFVFLPLIFLWPVIVFIARLLQASVIKTDYGRLVGDNRRIRTDLQALEKTASEACEAAIKAAEHRLMPPAKRAYAEAEQQIGNQFQENLQKIADDFRPSSDKLHEDTQQLWEDSACAGRGWDPSEWRNWSPDPSPEFAARIGTLDISADDLQSKLSGIDFSFSIPALIPFGDGRCLLISATGEVKSTAAEALQSTLIRALANTPAGKARFTLIDPVGLGHNVADFMHLGDFNSELISGKAWTEPQHIEQQLTLITEEMETVIQKYLRKQHASILEYNQVNHEVAEPFRFLVIFDFPVNFNEASARRLISIVKNGPRCGVFTMILMDSSKKLPYGCETVIDELRSSAAFFSPTSTNDTERQALSQSAKRTEIPRQETRAEPAMVEVGKIYRGKVVSIKEFGCFVEVLPGKQGLCHISELASFRVKEVEEIVKLGDEVTVKCIGIDDKGRVKLSRRAAIEDADSQVTPNPKNRASHSVSNLGGEDSQAKIVDWILDEFERKQGMDLRTQPDALQRIQDEAAKAKIALLSSRQCEINVPFIAADSSGPKHIHMKLTRAKLEQLCAPVFSEPPNHADHEESNCNIVPPRPPEIELSLLQAINMGAEELGYLGQYGDRKLFEFIQRMRTESFDVELAKCPSSEKIAVIRAIREGLRLGLTEAKTLVESAPIIVLSAVSASQAYAAAKELESAGAEVKVFPSET